MSFLLLSFLELRSLKICVLICGDLPGRRLVSGKIFRITGFLQNLYSQIFWLHGGGTLAAVVICLQKVMKEKNAMKD